ncbi:metal-sulfur cluster assembly factor [Candidatus Woesearchaeota archaeon]|nr:metal-sulfur cluster assembly factor [Candidatus Woesearchaeota archaeon]
MINRELVINALMGCVDPELGIDVWTLGLIYDLSITNTDVKITMTFTSPMCPYGPVMLEDLKERLSKVAGVKNIEVNVVFEPPWQPSKEIRSLLGL